MCTRIRNILVTLRLSSVTYYFKELFILFYHMMLRLGVKKHHAIKFINHQWFTDFRETL